MIPTKIKLGHGLLLAAKTDRFKTETLTLTLPFPMEQRKNRLSKLYFGMMKRGCVTYPDLASLSRRLDDLYDANIEMLTSPTGENIAAGFVVETLDSAYAGGGEDLLGAACDTLCKMIYEPLLTSDGGVDSGALEIEKRNLCDSIRAADNDPRAHSYGICRRLMFAGEPYGERSLGSVEEVMAVTPTELADFRQEYLKMSSPLFIYVGRRDEREVEKLIRERFGDFGGERMTLGETVLRPAPDSMRYTEEEMAVVQGKLTMGFRADMGALHEDMYAALLMNDIFGGSASSKLFRVIREEQSLCYSCTTSYDAAKGAIFMRSGIANENRDRVMEGVLRQLSEIQKGNISDYEFDCSKKSVLNYYRQAEDSPYSIESFYRTRFLCRNGTTLPDAMRLIEKVTKEDVVRAANRFAPDTCAFIRGNGTGEETYYDE